MISARQRQSHSLYHMHQASKDAHAAPNLAPVARVAQLVEQRIENPRVGGSNPPPGTIFYAFEKRLIPIPIDVPIKTPALLAAKSSHSP